MSCAATRSALYPPIRSVFERRRSGSAPPTPSLADQVKALFANGEQGALYYLTEDFAGLYKDHRGITPVTAVEQTVGLMLDKRLGLALGANVVTNGDMEAGVAPTIDWGTAVGTSGYNTTAPISGSQDYLVTITTGASSRPSFIWAGSPNLVVGRWYEVRIKYKVLSGAPVISNVYAGGTVQAAGLTLSGTGEIVMRVLAASTNAICGVYFGNATGSVQLDDITQRELAGNHAFQATAAARPVLSARHNLLLATETLATQSVTLLAAQHTLSFTGTGTVTLSGASTAGPLVGTGANNRVSLTFTPTAGSVTFTVSGSVTSAQLELGAVATRYQRVNTATDYDTVGFPHFIRFDGVDDKLTTTFPDLGSNATIARSVPSVGASILTGQTIGAGAWYDSTNHCGLVIVNRALTGPETASLTAYLNELAGI